MFDHVGILFNQPLGKAELLLIQSSDHSMHNYTGPDREMQWPLAEHPRLD